MNECTPQQVRDWLAAGLGDVEVLQVEGDGRHFRALIVASIFEGLSRRAKIFAIAFMPPYKGRVDIHGTFVGFYRRRRILACLAIFKNRFWQIVRFAPITISGAKNAALLLPELLLRFLLTR